VQSEAFEAKEFTFEDLHARINVALKLLGSVKPGAYAEKDDEIADV
jgi:hypothetical protein